MAVVQLSIGGVPVDADQALASAHSYLTRRDRFAYPAYDAFSTDGGWWRISDADLVAPVLLNAEMNSRVYYALEQLRPHLEQWLRDVPPDARLIEAGPTDLDRLGELFGVLDREDIPLKARGSILAKLMHRKRPAFIPLYDRSIDYCYRDAPGAPVPREPGRRWRDFLPLLGRAMADDLRSGAELFDAVVALAPGPTITPLRALDIVAWHAGRTRVGPAIWQAGSDDVPDEPADESTEVWLDLGDEQP